MLGILTSTLSRYLLKSYACHTVETGEEVLTQLMLPKLDRNSAQRIKSLVEQIVQKQENNPRYPYYLHEQKEINAIVYQLYDLNIEDIREVELWYCRRYPKLAEAQGILAEVRQKYADYLALCEQDIEQPLDTSSSTQSIQNRNTNEQVTALYGL